MEVEGGGAGGRVGVAYARQAGACPATKPEGCAAAGAAGARKRMREERGEALRRNSRLNLGVAELGGCYGCTIRLHE